MSQSADAVSQIPTSRIHRADNTSSRRTDRGSLFETVFRDAPGGILVVDAHTGAIVEANRAVRHHLGFDPRALVGTPLSSLEARRAGTVPLLEAVQAHGGFAAERELLRIDGSACLMHLRAAAASWVDHAVIIVTLGDVRDRKRAEAARRQAEENYRSIFDHTIEGIFQTTPDGKYLSANPALARMYGYSSPKTLIAGLTDIAGQLYVDPSRRTEFGRRLDKHDAVRAFESQIYRRDGKVIWISENARAVRDEHGALRYYEGTVIDISKRKRAEAAQRDEAEVARALAEVGREMMSSIDSPHIFERLCQLSAAALGCDWAQTLRWETERDEYVPVSSTGAVSATSPPRVPRAMLAPLLEALERDDVVILDGAAASLLPPPLRELQNDAGAALYFAVRRGGVCVGVLVAGYRTRPEPFTDVQRRIARGIAHLASLALEHARVLDELERANQLKSEFLATMSHELRTPLNIILGYNELLREHHFGSLTAQQNDIICRVGRSADELLELINATLDLARIESGTLPLDFDWVELPEFLHNLEDDMRELLRDKPELTLMWNVPAKLPSLNTDAAKLKVILKNLIHNAIKFTDAGSITVSAAEGSNGVEFTVSDTGIGIAPEALTIIFEAFRQADASMTRRHGGVGLGLHVVKRLSELLGGTVSVQSQVGQGSTFCVWLP